MKLTVTLDRDEDGVWVVECPSIPGCVSQGQTRAEALENIRDAIIACLEVRAERGLPLTIETCQVEVKQLSFRIDGVFLPERQDLPIYFTEVQFQNDPEFYARFFAEIFLYLKQTRLKNNWRGVVIYPNRRVERENIERYRELLQETRVQRIYLEELAESPPDSLGLATLELVSLPEAQVLNRGRELIVRVRETGVENRQQELLELIETILIYKLP
ncbi:MAG: Rpn family recombination-promoting nuclease/putative transposase, partial [Microcystis aeruginosa Ma_QC_Ch_20071001_S25D]